MAWISWEVAWSDEGYGVECFAVGNVPSQTRLGLEVGYEDFIEDLVTCSVCENGVCIVFVDGGRVAEVIRQEDGFGTEVGYVVESGDNVVPVVRSCVAVGLVSLTTKVAEKDDSGRVRADEKGTDESFKVFHCAGIGRVFGVELDDDQVGAIWEVMCAAKRKISRVGPPHGTVGQF